MGGDLRGVDCQGPRRVQRLREALELWRGAAAQDVDLPDSAAFNSEAAADPDEGDAPMLPTLPVTGLPLAAVVGTATALLAAGALAIK